MIERMLEVEAEDDMKRMETPYTGNLKGRSEAEGLEGGRKVQAPVQSRRALVPMNQSGINLDMSSELQVQ